MRYKAVFAACDKHKCAIAQVQNDLFKVVAPEQRRDLAGHEVVARAVGAVAADRVLVRDLAVEAVAGRLLGQVLEEGGVEDGDVGDVGEQSAGHFDALEVGRVVQRAQRHELLDPGHDVVVDEGGAGEVVPALDDAVADGDDIGLVEVGSLLGEDPQDLGQAEAVVGDRLDELEPAAVVLVGDGARLLPDALDEPGGQGGAGVGVDQLVLDPNASSLVVSTLKNCERGF